MVSQRTNASNINTRLQSLKNVTIYTAYLVVFWGCYRFLFKFPDELEELVIKPILWLLPIAYFLKKEREGLFSIGITFKKLFLAVYISLGLGALFVAESILVNYLKYKGFNFAANIGDKAFFVSLGLSLATAISEEVSFRGYIFNRLWKNINSEWLANAISSIAWILIHIPITIFVLKLGLGASISYLFLTGIFGIGSAFVFARTGNIVSSILLHLLWEWPIILFR